MAVRADARTLGPSEGRTGSLGSIGVRFMVDGDTAGGGFSLVEHPMPPRALAAPLHRHTHEDEYSYVVEGRMGALLGDRVLELGEIARVDPAVLAALRERYGLDMDPSSVPGLVERFGVRLEGRPLDR